MNTNKILPININISHHSTPLPITSHSKLQHQLRHAHQPALSGSHNESGHVKPNQLSSIRTIPLPRGAEVHLYPGERREGGREGDWECKLWCVQYLCDGAADCSDGYDEDARLCTAARRPPVEETSSFLKSLLASHGPNYLEKLFGPKARNNMQQLGGVETVAIALSGGLVVVVMPWTKIKIFYSFYLFRIRDSR